MIKINALDFLNNDKFGVDLYAESGELICDSEVDVTPELLLMLYFKKIFVKEPITPSASEASSEGNESQQQAEDALIAASKNVKIEKIGFDEATANKVVEHCMVMATMLGLDSDAINTLQKAAYYHNIGSIDMLTDEIDDPNFKKKRAQLGYKYILEKLELPEKVAKVAKLYLSSYDSNRYELDKKNRANIPLHQIVAIASYYEEFLAQSSSKEEALVKLLRLGGNKFNIYLLHKFVYRMRKTNA